MDIRKMYRNARNVMGKLILLLVLTISCTACNAKKDEVPSAEDKGNTEATASKSDRKLSTTPTEKDNSVDDDNTAMINEDNSQEESKKEADNSEDTTKEAELTEELEESDTTLSDSDSKHETFKIMNPDEAEYFGESPTFIISYDEDGIQITLDFVGSNTFAMYEPADTSFSAQPEVISFSMGDESGMGVPSDHNSTLELKVNGDEATIIFHYPEGGQSDPISFERID